MQNALTTIADRVRDEVRRYSERALGGSVPLLADEGAGGEGDRGDAHRFRSAPALLRRCRRRGGLDQRPGRGVHRARRGAELTGIHLTDGEVRDLVERMLQSSGRRVDLSSPFVDASLPDGSRLHVVIPDITRRHWAVNVRKFSQRIRDLQRLVALGSLTQQAALRPAPGRGTNRGCPRSST